MLITTSFLCTFFLISSIFKRNTTSADTTYPVQLDQPPSWQHLTLDSWCDSFCAYTDLLLKYASLHYGKRRQLTNFESILWEGEILHFDVQQTPPLRNKIHCKTFLIHVFKRSLKLNTFRYLILRIQFKNLTQSY